MLTGSIGAIGDEVPTLYTAIKQAKHRKCIILLLPRDLFSISSRNAPIYHFCLWISSSRTHSNDCLAHGGNIICRNYLAWIVVFMALIFQCSVHKPRYIKTVREEKTMHCGNPVARLQAAADQALCGRGFRPNVVTMQTNDTEQQAAVCAGLAMRPRLWVASLYQHSSCCWAQWHDNIRVWLKFS